MTHTGAPRETSPRKDYQLHLVDAWWRAANYLTVGQIYLRENPLLREPLAAEHIKARLIGHWGTAPALNFVYAHLNRLIVRRSLNVLFVAGAGHGGAAMVANAWLDQTYSERYPSVPQGLEGMHRLFRQYATPGGIPSYSSPATPGAIQEGGEVGYSLAHAFGAALDNPSLLVACMIGDGEAETATLAASWHLNKFLNPDTDGVVLPILNLNGYKIDNPSVLARIPERELLELFRGYGYSPRIVAGGFGKEEPLEMHARFAAALDAAADDIASIRTRARSAQPGSRPAWPLIILRTPKGWTGPEVVDGLRIEGTWRSHDVPLVPVAEDAGHLQLLEQWMTGYRPEELFDRDGFPTPALSAIRPKGKARMSAIEAANGGVSLIPMVLPPAGNRGVDIRTGRGVSAEATRVLGTWLADVMRLNARNFRLFGPDELYSNRLEAVLEVTARQWQGVVDPSDQHLAREGRVIELLSENVVQGLLEGYLLTGRHGLMNSYEAFIQIVDSMFNQHAKWLEAATDVQWRHSISSLTYLLSSHVWRQDHNGFSHQDPGFLNVVVSKSPNVVRVYLPPDANSLLVTVEHCLTTRDHVNVIVAGKHPAPTFLSVAEARTHGERGLGIWAWAGTERDGEPADVVVGCAGDVPTLEALAAVSLLRVHIPELRIRFVNVVDLMRLQSSEQHPHGLTRDAFDAVFTVDRPIVFAFHGYPALIHQLAYRHTNHANLHVLGFHEKGTTTTPFDLLMANGLDRYGIAMEVIRRVPGLRERFAALSEHLGDERSRLRAYAYEHGVDSPEVTGWEWLGAT